MSEEDVNQTTRVICHPITSVDQPAGGQIALFRPRKDTFLKYYVPPLPTSTKPPRVGLPLTMPPIIQLTIPEIFTALNDYISRKFHRIFRPIFIYDVKMFDAFIYTLTTSYERRYSKWQFNPYKPDDPIDEPTRIHRIVDPWLVPARPDDKFTKGSKIERVPRSDFVMTCFKCEGSGIVKCPWCNGTGKDPFGKCTLCTGSGMYKCKVCDGYQRIKLYLVTKVKWSVKRTSIVIDTSNSGIKDTTFFTSKMMTVLDEEVVSAPFIAKLFDETNSYQEKLSHPINYVILDHESSCGPYKKIILQRQTIGHIPVAAISYEFEKKYHTFHIIGKEKKVVFHHSPSSLCSIL